MTRSAERLARWSCAPALAAVLALGAGCGAVHGGAVSETGGCAQTLPAAARLVGTRGTLLHAKVLRTGAVRKLLQSGALPPVPGAPPPAPSCLLVYRGAFGPQRAQPAGGGKRAPYLVLLIRIHRPVTMARLVTSRLPAAVRHSS